MSSVVLAAPKKMIELSVPSWQTLAVPLPGQDAVAGAPRNCGRG